MAVHVILHMMKFKAMLLTIVLFNQSPIVLSTRQRCQFSETLSQYSSLMSKSCTGAIRQEIKFTDTNGMIICRCTTRSTQSLHSLSTLEAAFPKKLFHSLNVKGSFTPSGLGSSYDHRTTKRTGLL